MQCNTVYIIDGSSLIYRSFFALPKLSTKNGFPTSAIYGFLRSMLAIMKSERPKCLVVIFDHPAPTKREKVYREYKINRPKMPDPLKVQIPVIKELLKIMGIPMIEKEGYEADDIVGFLAIKFSSEGKKVKIYTPDKDMLQLVSDNVIVINPMNNEIFDREKVFKKYGVFPEKIPDFLALVGDKVDNIEGIKGVGQKKAVEILKKYQSVENILRNWDRFSKEYPEADREKLELSYYLVKLHTEVGGEFGEINVELKEPDWNLLEKRIKDLEMKSLLKDVDILKVAKKQATLF